MIGCSAQENGYFLYIIGMDARKNIEFSNATAMCLKNKYIQYVCKLEKMNKAILLSEKQKTNLHWDERITCESNLELYRELTEKHLHSIYQRHPRSIMVFFDLPVITSANRKDYRDFHKYLIKTGFLMMQESVYCRLAQNFTMADAIVENIRKNKPADGLVQVLKITEKQFGKMEFIVGTKKSEILDTDERVVII